MNLKLETPMLTFSGEVHYPYSLTMSVGARNAWTNLDLTTYMIPHNCFLFLLLNLSWSFLLATNCSGLLSYSQEFKVLRLSGLPPLNANRHVYDLHKASWLDYALDDFNLTMLLPPDVCTKAFRFLITEIPGAWEKPYEYLREEIDFRLQFRSKYITLKHTKWAWEKITYW